LINASKLENVLKNPQTSVIYTTDYGFNTMLLFWIYI
jgi:hypothetical protein